MFRSFSNEPSLLALSPFLSLSQQIHTDTCTQIREHTARSPFFFVVLPCPRRSNGGSSLFRLLASRRLGTRVRVSTSIERRITRRSLDYGREKEGFEEDSRRE